MLSTRRILLAATLVAAAGLAVLAARWAPATGLVLALASPTAERWFMALAPAALVEDIVIVVGDMRLRADLYRPPAPRGAILLVHGLSRDGHRKPDLARLARLLARSGRLVLVPHFPGLAAFRLDGREVDQILGAITFLQGSSPVVGVAGFSFGAGPTLLAAAEAPGLTVVGSFGGYADLRHVVRFVTTGVHTFGGRRHVRRQEEYNRGKILALLSAFVDDGPDRARLAVIAERRLADPAMDTSALSVGLGAAGRAVLAVVTNRQEDAVDGLLERLPLRAREALDRLSRLRAVPRIEARLLIAHGEDDDSIPFTESLRLAAAAGPGTHATILRTFHHTGPAAFWAVAGARMADSWGLLRLIDDLLA